MLSERIINVMHNVWDSHRYLRELLDEELNADNASFDWFHLYMPKDTTEEQLVELLGEPVEKRTPDEYTHYKFNVEGMPIVVLLSRNDGGADNDVADTTEEAD